MFDNFETDRSNIPTIRQLYLAIKNMRDFLLSKPSNGEVQGYNYSDNKFFKKDNRVLYKILYNQIEEWNTKANTEGYYKYKHNNPYKTLSEFLREGDISRLVKKYYSIPVPVVAKIRKFFEWIFDQISKFKPEAIIKN